jgi:hypothetical protein
VNAITGGTLDKMAPPRFRLGKFEAKTSFRRVLAGDPSKGCSYSRL